MHTKSIPLLFAIALYLGCNLSVYAQPAPIDPFKYDLPRKNTKELTFYGFYINQMVSSNFYPQNDLLKGQVIGRLFGKSSATTSDSTTAHYFEQRFIPFFIYQPKLFNGKALIRASFEIDWTWGDASYGAGGNFGSAISADQVNLQTQNIELEFIPRKFWAINVGLQRLFDTPNNPYRTIFETMTQSAYRLSYWGTDGVGISVRYDRDFTKVKGGFYQLYENLIQSNDDVYLGEITAERQWTKKWKAGASAYYVKDYSNSQGGVSILGQGLNATLLNAYTGTFKFEFGSNPYHADIVWLGTYFSRNLDLVQDNFSLTGFFNYNAGIANVKKGASWQRGATIGGYAANLRAVYRYGQTTKDIVSVDGIYTTGDENRLSDKKYSGVITGNTWGAPGAIFVSTGAYILFPHMNVVNRYTPLIADISNMGYGLRGGTLNLSHAFVPNKFYSKIGAAWAQSQVSPIGGGKTMGTELNGMIGIVPGTLMELELHAAHVWLGNFYDSNDASYGFDVNGDYYTSRPANPWTVFLVFKWLMF